MTKELRVYIVDNGGQWTHREWRVLRDLGITTEIIPNTLEVVELLKMDPDGLVLSGGAPRIDSEIPKLGLTGEYLNIGKFPILGICVGFQYIALHFGGTAGPAETPEFGKAELFIENHDDLFKGLPDNIQAWESHNDEIKTLPEYFVNLAHSTNCRIQAFRSEKKPIYGVQFHPEVEHTDYGYDIFKNFLRICEEY